jgi:hypothetical protein
MKHRWTTGAAIVALCLFSLAFYRQIVLAAGGNHPAILSGPDAMTYFYPYRAYAAQAIRSGRIPLWNPYLFTGVPFLANPQAAVFYPPNLALCWLPAPYQVAWSIVLHVALAAVLAYLYARRALRLSALPAFLAASAFAWGGFISGQVEHVNQLNVSAWFPLLLLLWERRSRARAASARTAALLGLGATIGLGLLAGHTQSSYISLFGLGVYALVSLLLHRGRDARFCVSTMARWAAVAGAIAAAIALGVGLAAVQLVPTAELSALSIRSGGLDYREVVAFSLRPSPRLLRYTFFPPWGGNLDDAFGGSFYTEYLAYLGLVPLLLAAVAGIAGVRQVVRHGLKSLHETHFGPAWLTMIVLAGLGVFLALGLYNPLYWILFKIVPGFNLFRVPARWLLLYAFGAAMLAGIGLQLVQDALGARHKPGLGPAVSGAAVTGALVAGAAVIGALAELLAASQALPLGHATALEAFTSLRTAPAHILAAQRQTPMPGRFLSLSDIVFDPGDLPEMQQILGGQLSAQALYAYVVNVKRQEILAPNLPLAWRIYAVDGYDGGVLPLARYVRLQQLFLDPDEILTDGRLREGIKRIPPSRLLSILGVRYVLTDKVHDVWIDDVFYDLAFDAVLLGGKGQPQPPAQAVVVADVTPFRATGLGVVSCMEGAPVVQEGTPVAEVRLTSATGEVQTLLLRAGQETAPGMHEGDASQAQPAGVACVPARQRSDPSQGQAYVARLSWAAPMTVARVEVAALRHAIRIRGLTLIDERDGSNVPLALSTEGRFRQVHSGDVKIYEVLDALPRAYAVHHTRILPDDSAIAAMQDTTFDPARSAILAAGRELDGPPSSGAPSSTVAVEGYAPEQVTLRASLSAPGYVVLSDSWYPGWKAYVDGQEAEIERANVLFRAVYVPAGTHTVRLEYRPVSYRVGLGISTVTLAGLAAAWALLKRKRTRRPKPVGV